MLWTYCYFVILFANYTIFWTLTYKADKAWFFKEYWQSHCKIQTSEEVFWSTYTNIFLKNMAASITLKF